MGHYNPDIIRRIQENLPNTIDRFQADYELREKERRPTQSPDQMATCYGFLMPDELTLHKRRPPPVVEMLDECRNLGITGKSVPDDDFYVLAGMAYYGLDNVELSTGMINAVFQFAHHWRDKRFSPQQLLSLVFTFGLGVGRVTTGDEWDGTWPNAVWALQYWLMQLEQVNIECLRKIGVRVTTPSGDAAKDVVPIILGNYNQQYINCYLNHFPGAIRKDAVRRHRNNHMLEGWLKRPKKTWPSPNFDNSYYPVSRHVFRGFIGGQPKHSDKFAQGMLYAWLAQNGDALRSYPVLICCGPTRDHTTNSCHHRWGEFRLCSQCGTENPTFHSTKRLDRTDSTEYTLTKMSRCVIGECKNYCEAGLARCRVCEANGRMEKSNRRTTRITVYHWKEAPKDYRRDEEGYRKSDIELEDDSDVFGDEDDYYED